MIAPPGARAPAELRVAVHPRVRVLDRGRVLMGGSPARVMRLSEEGARVIAGWRSPAPVGEGPAPRALARRLLDAGILSPYPAAQATSALTVVVPVRDRPAQLARCLDAIRAGDPPVPVIVVDDGSADPSAVHAVCVDRGAALIRHAVPRGAAAARNRGLAACSTPYVAFVDSDVVVPAPWAGSLLGHFADPCVGAVAPRVRALPPSRGLIGGYEARHSPLDMGAEPGLVGPGRPTPYVPSAVLLVRRDSVPRGFDETLTIGEDVDLVWRLVASGWRVAYAPDTHVWHDHRLRLRAFVDRRRVYASSVAPLARRHPDALPAARLSPWMALPWALMLAGGRRTALVATLVEATLLARRLPGSRRRRYGLAATLVARGQLATGLGLAQATRRAWAPAVALAAIRRASAQRLLLLAFVAPVVEDAARTRRLQAVPGDAALRLLDEVLALWGTWDGCLRHRTMRPLLPSWRPPPRGRIA